VPYVEAHHVTPVSERQIGSLATSNILTVCANHHRQKQYGKVQVDILENESAIEFDAQTIAIRRFSAF
jgi:predicted HNH restriction endonuclease